MDYNDIRNIVIAKKISGGGSPAPTPTYQQKSVTPDFSGGNVDVTADSGYDALSQVTVQKDSNLIAENIKKDVTVHGITGSYEGGGGDADALIDRSATSITSNVTSVGDYAFYYLTSLTSASFPEALLLGSNSFYNCSNLQSVSAPQCTELKGSVFNKCVGLQNVSFPEVIKVGSDAFSGCSFLASVDLPKMTTLLGMNCFQNCTALETIDLPKCTNLGKAAFNGCKKLNKVILRADTMCVTGSDGLFMNNCPFNTGYAGGILYVPQALISTYQANATWAAILAKNENNQILAIEGSPYEE